MSAATLNGPLRKMRLFIINTFQSAADQLCPENDEDRWFFWAKLTGGPGLVYFSIAAAWNRRLLQEEMD